MQIRHLMVISMAAAFVAVPFAAQAPQAHAETETTYTFQIETRGTVHADPAAFAVEVDDILGDARGWTLGGSVAFQPVEANADLRVILASPQVVENAAGVCSRHYSCRVGDAVYINDRNWRESTPAFRDAGGDLATYREYLINHEVGHFLGFGHYDCSSAGEPAPVMQQQSIRLDGCEPEGWPSAWERDTLGDRLGVPVHDDWQFTDVLRGDTHRDDIHTLAAADVVEGFPEGAFRPATDVTRAQVATFLARALNLETDGAPDFEDVSEDHTHADAIAAADEHGMVTGYEDGLFRPQEHVSRAQMASMIARGYDLEAPDDHESSFDDVDPDSEHAEAIAAIEAEGISTGFGDGTYRPNDEVSRAEMAAFIARAGIEE